MRDFYEVMNEMGTFLDAITLPEEVEG